MATGPYSPCPCGSGKQFKWCCQPIYAGINRAFDQEEQGQHDTARRVMEEVTAQHPENPEAWGQLARLLSMHGKLDEADKALDRAFALNPNYPFGLLLRATFRHHEGEVPGALLLARRAAAHYSAEAHDRLAEVYFLIYDCESRLHRPVAARAALRLVVHYSPGDDQVRESFDALFGPDGRLPEAARHDYQLLPPPAAAGPERKAAWDRARQTAGSPSLADLVGIYEPLTRGDDADAPAWFNLGLAHAWLGDNKAALEAVNEYLDRETDEGKATTAAALAEVLRCGHGMEDDADYVEYSFVFPLRDPEAVIALVREWLGSGRLLQGPPPQEGSFFGVVLELTPTGLITAGAPPSETAPLAGYLLILGGMVRVWGTGKEAVNRLRDELRTRLKLPLDEARESRGPIQFQDVVSEALIFPTGPAVKLSVEKVIEHAGKYYEERWLHQPRRVLLGNSPLDAAGCARLRKRLLGVVKFIHDCAAQTMIKDYEFDRLRRKLGLTAGAPAPGEPGAPTPGEPGTLAPGGDIASMNAADLAALKVDALSEEQLEQAFQTSRKLDARELNLHFGRALAARPVNPARPDRYPLYSFLIDRALRDGEKDAALDYVNEGEKADCEQNEGRRRNDYELRRAQVHAKRGEADQADDVFRRLIERVPDELKYRSTAAEAMLSLGQGARALRFAEEGLAEARRQKNRDAEQHLMELAGAAKKQMG
jgi:tetratricopeptide (TPR) repeat protein